MQVKETVKSIDSPEEMLQYGAELGRKLARPNLVLALKGDLGAGKTTFAKGFISALTHIDSHQIQSPTFTFLQVYDDSVFHFDLYRLEHYTQFQSAGFSDYLNAGGICCIEWPERIEPLLPDDALFLEITYLGEQRRQCTLSQGKPA